MRIPARFNGPRTTGHGGYAAGLFASALSPGPVAVNLRSPPPLETDLAVREVDDGVEIYAADTLVATAAPAGPPADPPAPLTPAEAAAAAQDPATFAEGCEFTTCFGCGAEREDGLRLFAGPVGDGRVAAAWTPAAAEPPASVPAGGPLPAPAPLPAVPVDDLLVWAALDCPSGAAVWDRPGPPMVLARFAVHCLGPVTPGVPHAVVAAETARDGRKRTSVMALYDDAGELRAHGEALWITIPTS